MQESTGKAALVRRDGSALLDRLLDTPRITEIVPRLPPVTLHRVIERYGLEDCGALLALATPGQVAQIFDLDLWRQPDAGRDAQFDADRFGVWLEVLVEQGTEVAARVLAGLDVDLVAAGLSQHVRVFDIATLDAYVTTDGTEIPAVIERDGGLGCDIAGRRLIPRRADAWDAIADVLAELAATYADVFGRLMRACSALSNSRREIDGLDDLLTTADQAMFDLADERAQRREARGFASAAEARGFLESARRLRLDGAVPPPVRAMPCPPVEAQAPTIPPLDAGSEVSATDPASPADLAAREAATAAVFELLHEAGVIVPPRARLGAPSDPASAKEPAGEPVRGSALAGFHAHMQEALARDPMVAVARQDEIAWLANALMAGGTIDTRPFTTQEASDAVIATCNLGLECWPAAWGGGDSLPDAFLVHRDLISVFQVGWTVLHDDVCAGAASGLLDALAGLPAHDPETQADLGALRVALLRQLRAGTPWGARDAMDVLATLDLPAWTTLLALIAECPVLAATIDPSAPKGRRTIDPSAFTFISERRQLTAVAEFLDSLPATLRG